MDAENALTKSCMGTYAQLGQAFLTAVFAINFPPAMRADVDALLTAVNHQITIETVLSQLAQPLLDTEDFTRWEQATLDVKATSNVVRHDLGLPPGAS